jgi:hypothetical protein
MKNTVKILFLSATLATGAFASGGGPAAPPRPPKKEKDMPKKSEMSMMETIDSARYELGKAVYTGKYTAVNNRQKMSEQKKALMMMSNKAGSKVKDLSSLAGKISDEQLKALEYYLSKRFMQKA